jgi:hypothetical protein
MRFLVGVALLPVLAMATNIAPSHPAYQWHTFFGGDIEDSANLPASTVDADGNLYVTGATRYPWNGVGDPGVQSAVGYQGYLAKISPTGQLIWSSFFANPAWPGRQDGLHPRAIARDSAGNIYISGAGIIDPFNCTSCGSFALETNPNGAFLGGANFGGPSNDTRAYSEVFGMTYNAADGHVYITGGAGKQWWAPPETTVTPLSGAQMMFILQVGSLASGSGLGWVGFYGPPCRTMAPRCLGKALPPTPPQICMSPELKVAIWRSGRSPMPEYWIGKTSMAWAKAMPWRHMATMSTLVAIQ